MLFEFLKYLQPTHYFQLPRANGQSVFPLVNDLPNSVVAKLKQDSYYVSDFAKDYDLSWQAVQTGYIGDAKTYLDFEPVPVQDNYHFIRKQFHPGWVFYVLFIRLLTFHDPITEIRAWMNTSHVKKEPIEAIKYEAWEGYESNLIVQESLVSVVIPTLNRYEYLKDVLHDFEKQDYSNFEIIVVDQSEPFQSEFYTAFNLNIQVIQQEEKALWLARNTAIKASKGGLIALSEDDVRVFPDWISTHLKCLDFFKAKVSAGVFYPEGKQIPEERSFFMQASQFATGNAMLYKSVFERVGLFDRQFEKQRMGDGEFGLRVYLEGIRSVSNPLASCVDVKASIGGLREMGSWDAFRTKKWFSPRPIPSVLYLYRSYFGRQAAIWALFRTVPLSIMPYQFKKNKPMLVVGLFLCVLLTPLVCFQVWKSWRLASVKLEEGALIEELTIDD
ncbi:glycosyltransferase family A protein [Formosa sp. PL04]|uniref:glycosyltransferase family A protein n=1 Tax=Formosa sp. PL04 TaxID=3081755 RepID=UPI0029829F5E|nr:glycosyltransferase family A protein [Formosa sp. PL04]MDW5290735.1 glycosyltransferase family A protein [Formosa sp. PL04]